MSIITQICKSPDGKQYEFDTKKCDSLDEDGVCEYMGGYCHWMRIEEETDYNDLGWK
jgi:hypothetical protein